MFKKSQKNNTVSNCKALLYTKYFNWRAVQVHSIMNNLIKSLIYFNILKISINFAEGQINFSTIISDLDEQHRLKSSTVNEKFSQII